jgi:hypothetical protein
MAHNVNAPWNPYLVLLIAILLPGMGHVVSGATRRGLMLQLFMMMGGFVTWHLAAPGTSLVGKLAGGLFVYALSLPEAYRLGRIRAANASFAAA